MTRVIIKRIFNIAFARGKKNDRHYRREISIAHRYSGFAFRICDIGIYYTGFAVETSYCFRALPQLLAESPATFDPGTPATFVGYLRTMLSTSHYHRLERETLIV